MSTSYKPDIDLAWGRATITSLKLAAHLGIEHDALMRAIRAVRCGEAFHRRCFIPATRKRQPIFRITKDGFILLVLSMEGIDAASRPEWIEPWLEAYAEAQAKLAGPATPRRRQKGAAPVTGRSGTAPVEQAPPGQPLPVPFQGATLFVVEHQGEPYVPMRPIVEGMGLDWKSQYVKLLDRFRSCVVQITTQLPGDTQKREVVCMLLRKLPGWLYSVNPDKVRPELREKILAYQNECDDVLWRYWTQGRVERPGRADAAAEPRRLAPRAGPFVLDDAFVARVYVALGRKAVQTEVLRRLLSWGALESWVRLSVREIARHPPISSSAVQKAAHLLKERGILAMKDGGPNRSWSYQVLQQPLADLLARVGQVHLQSMQDEARRYEITTLGRKTILH